MKKDNEICVGINATALLSPRTGIGNYIFEIGREFLASPEIRPRFFYGGYWSDSLRQNPLANIASVKSGIRKCVPNVYAVQRFVAQMGFAAGVRRNPIDLYHEPSCLAYRFDGPIVTTVHDLSWIRHPETHPRDRVRALDRYFPGALERSSAIITDCGFVKDELVEVFGISPARIYPVPLGVSPLFRPVPIEECRAILAGNGFDFGRYFLSVGTLEPRKNIPTIIDAFTRLRPEIQERYPLVLVGMRGWLTNGIEAKMRPLAEKGVIKALGYVPDQQMPALYSGATAFLFPSLYEGFGLPPLEAMACGAPVIASNNSSLPEVVGDAGASFDPMDVEGIAEAMYRMVDDATWREELSAKGMRRAATFSWKRTADETIAVYRGVLNVR
jgi:alpha-1,3-rhamnosyl/mannosyltransferase